MSSVPIPISQSYDGTIGTSNMVGLVLSTITYGVHFVLFIYLIRLHIDPSLYALKSRKPMKPDWRLMGHATALFVLGTTGLCLQAWLNHRAFIVHQDFPGGPLAYMIATSKDPANLATASVYVALNWFADGMLLYRFLCLFTPRCILVVSITMLISLIVTGSLFVPNFSTLPVSSWTGWDVTPSLIYLILSLLFHILFTSMIVFRLIQFRRGLCEVVEERSCSIYMRGIISMWIESTALYAAIALTCIVACGLGSPVQNALLPVFGQLQPISPLLITIRVLEYRSMWRDTRPSPARSAISFSKRPLSPATAFGTTTTDEAQKCPPYPQRCLSRSSTTTNSFDLRFGSDFRTHASSPFRDDVSANILEDVVIRTKEWKDEKCWTGPEESDADLSYPFILPIF